MIRAAIGPMTAEIAIGGETWGFHRVVPPLPATIGLTRRQRDLLDLLWARQAAGQPSPTFDQMMPELGFASKDSIARLVKALVERGVVTRGGRYERGLRVVTPAEAAPADFPLVHGSLS